MPPPSLFSTTTTTLLLLLRFCNLSVSLTEPDFSPFPGCEGTFSCGNIHNLTYPFTGGDRPDHCGSPEFRLTCPVDSYPELTIDSVPYRVLEANLTGKTLVLARSDLWNNTCPSTFVNSTLDSTIFYTNGGQNVDLTIFFGCSSSPMFIQPQNRFYCDVGGVDVTDSYFLIGEVPIDPILKMIHCTNGVSIPLLRTVGADLNRSLLTLAEALTRGFEVIYSDPYGDRCSECSRSDGECGFDVTTSKPICICNSRICSPPVLPTIGAILVGAAIGWGIFVCKRRSKRRAAKEVATPQTESKAILTIGSSNRFNSDTRSNFNSSVPSYPSSKTTKEFGKCSYFGAQVFTYEELEVATDNFDDSRELGDGGCGTVYHGSLINLFVLQILIFSVFGVVLIELISSLQAVDTSRDRLDINLAAMAINKIQSHMLDELVDKSIGFETNGLVRRMITLVAELAFRCLQQASGIRPTMKEVLKILRGIQNDELNAQKPEVLDIMVYDGALFKDHNTEPPSPDYGATNKLYGSCMPNSSEC
ncbi:hypothetical protein L1987_44362 [Smallanthus sonchifolius]|uniref:Uncharacterized protein n=1 Tax=Smallanthus sonchifolius TaxID=185202 RepID=A0ACB9GQE8_9ASTR|nr:hypothetical protein L1987_44362 [Smallanthus sonchifolius]